MLITDIGMRQTSPSSTGTRTSQPNSHTKSPRLYTRAFPSPSMYTYLPNAVLSDLISTRLSVLTLTDSYLRPTTDNCLGTTNSRGTKTPPNPHRADHHLTRAACADTYV
ncbi:hypothetical protein BDN70DRAFT_872997 [Pholiota conissans]|uniref:Uncharacterized protein n=1 Tax=Pholiota conissans TaxID=109636 RepID=A0A9P5ZBG7_9AGAR|nr:hypothetical protein BDN70DRAFT_872997 [Pholiota conissans]